MSIRGDVIRYMFEGNADPLANCIARYDTAVSPEAVVTALKGTLLIMIYDGNAVDKDVYINDDGATSWVLINNETA